MKWLNTKIRVGLAALTSCAMLGIPMTVAQAAANSGDPQVTPRASCGEVMNPSITGGSAHWVLTCSDGNVTIEGWVKDTLPDGRCAAVNAKFSDGTAQSMDACRVNKENTFKWTGLETSLMPTCTSTADPFSVI